MRMRPDDHESGLTDSEWYLRDEDHRPGAEDEQNMIICLFYPPGLQPQILQKSILML